MNTRSLTWIGMFVGSTLGGLVPLLWGADAFSIASLLFSSVGAIAGIWIAYNLATQ